MLTYTFQLHMGPLSKLPTFDTVWLLLQSHTRTHAHTHTHKFIYTIHTHIHTNIRITHTHKNSYKEGIL